MKREISRLSFSISSITFLYLSILHTSQVSDGTAEAEDIRGRHREQQLQGQLLHRGQSMPQFLVLALPFDRKNNTGQTNLRLVASVQ